MEQVPAELRRSIWIRDEFSCKSCGRTLGWDELNIGFMGKGDDPDSMITLCSECINSENRPIDDPRLARFMGIVRELGGIEAEFEPECPNELTRLKEAVSQLESENRFLKEDNEKKFRLLVGYKGQADKALEDYQNLKRRSEREVSSRVGMAMRRTLLGLIAAIDDLDRSIRSIGPDAAKGLLAVRRNMVGTLEESGVTLIDPSGKFDPNQHEAVEAKEVQGIPDGSVLEVHSQGYMFEGKVIRPARVTVSRSIRREEVEFELFEEDASTEEGPEKAHHPPSRPSSSSPDTRRQRSGRAVQRRRRSRPA